MDPRLFRDVLGHYPTGVALVTGIGAAGDPIGMIVGSFTSVSLDPPLVAFLPATTSKSFALLRDASTFCVNVLSADQEWLCRRFSSPGEDKWAGVEWTPSATGAPILADAVAWIECQQASITEAGDHFIVLCRVIDLGVQNSTSPLLFFQGGYGRFTMSALVAASTPDLVNALRLAEHARDSIETLASRTGMSVDLIAQVGSDLVFVGSASGADVAPSTPALGTRIPLMAPLGEQFVAWAGDEAAQQWLTRSGVNDEETRDALLDRLRLARERGWSMSRLEADDELDFYQTLRDYTDVDLVPARERALRERIMKWSRNYDSVQIDPDADYAAHALVVPVHDRANRVVFDVRLVNLPRPATGAQLLDWVQDLRRCAAAISARIAGNEPTQMSRHASGMH